MSLADIITHFNSGEQDALYTAHKHLTAALEAAKHRPSNSPDKIIKTYKLHRSHYMHTFAPKTASLPMCSSLVYIKSNSVYTEDGNSHTFPYRPLDRDTTYFADSAFRIKLDKITDTNKYRFKPVGVLTPSWEIYNNETNTLIDTFGPNGITSPELTALMCYSVNMQAWSVMVPTEDGFTYVSPFSPLCMSKAAEKSELISQITNDLDEKLANKLNSVMSSSSTTEDDDDLTSVHEKEYVVTKEFGIPVATDSKLTSVVLAEDLNAVIKSTKGIKYVNAAGKVFYLTPSKLRVVVKYTSGFTDHEGETVQIDSTASKHRPWIRAVDWVGHAAVKKHAYRISSSCLFNFENNDYYRFMEKSTIPSHELSAYKSLVGHYDEEHLENSKVLGEGMRQRYTVETGYQVPRCGSLSMDLIVPTAFASNDMCRSLPVTAFNSLEHAPNCTIAPLNELVYSVAAPIHYNNVTRTVIPGFLDENVVHKVPITMEDYVVTSGNGFKLASAEIGMYYRSISVHTDLDKHIQSSVHNIQVKLPVIIKQAVTFNTPTLNMSLKNQLKALVTSIKVGVSPRSEDIPVHPNNWHRFGLLSEQKIPLVNMTGPYRGVVEHGLTKTVQTPIVEAYEVKLSTFPVFDHTVHNNKVISSYIPYLNSHEGKMNKFNDPAIFLIPFDLKAHSELHSGHINMIRPNATDLTLHMSPKIYDNLKKMNINNLEVVICAETLNTVRIIGGVASISFNYS